MKLTRKKINEIELLVTKTTLHFFATFLNPKYRGPNFKWVDFESIVLNYLEIYCYEFKSKEEQDFLIKTASIICKKTLKNSGLLNETQNNIEAT